MIALYPRIFYFLARKILQKFRRGSLSIGTLSSVGIGKINDIRKRRRYGNYWNAYRKSRLIYLTLKLSMMLI